MCTRALRLLSNWALDELELRRLELITDPDNHRLPAGRREGRIPSRGCAQVPHVHPDGRLRDAVMFSLLPGELVE